VLRFARDPLHRMSELFDAYGDVVALDRRGGTRIFSSREVCRGTIFGRGPEFLQAVELDPETFHRSATSGRVYPHGRTSARASKLHEWGTGLFAVNEDEHARHRKLLNPAFSRAAIEGWIPTFAEIALRLADAWEDGREIDLHDAMKEMTLRIATRSLFGEELGRQDALPIAAERSLAALISPGVILARLDWPGLPYRRFLDNVVALSEAAHRMVQQRREEGASGSDLLSTLIREASSDAAGLSDSDVVGHLGVLLAASHETTAFAISAALFLLSQHPRVANDVVDEVQATLRGGVPGPDQLRAMPLLERVINETLRLLPPAPWTARETSRGTSLLGLELEAGTELIPAIFHTHRMPERWSEPAAFLPERWQGEAPGPYAFNPFGGGPRMCIGRNFALVEMRLVLSLLLSRFRFETRPGRVDPCMSITMSFRSGLPMRLRKADGAWSAGWTAAEGDIHRYVALPR
jgi:cytochrome P450